MGTFNTKKTLFASPALIPAIAEQITRDFQAEGYEAISETLTSGGAEVSVSKGGMFKSVVGMKTALKISLTPQNGSIVFDAGVGIFGKQLVPALVMWYVGWPILLTQIWGLIQQSKLDDKALTIAEKVIADSGETANEDTPLSAAFRFCTACGTKNLETANSCCGCGKPL